MTFNPLDASTTRISDQWKLPHGYQQALLSDEAELDIYPDGPDWTDMLTLNETGLDAGRYLYRTHETRPSRLNPTAFAGGALSVIDLHTGQSRLLAQRRDWEAVDGLVWTPWGTLLFNEETGHALLPDPDMPQAEHGLVYELTLQPDDPSRMFKVTARPALGSLAHEGIEWDEQGHVYVIDEYKAGGIYRFTPDRPGDLSSGELAVLKLGHGLARDGTGPARWVALDREAVRLSARKAAAKIGAARYERPEDLERIGNTLYVAVTGEHRVLAISLGEQPVVREFVSGEDVSETRASFRKPDNLAAGPNGRLWIVEDNRPSDIWVAEPDGDGDGRSDRLSLFGSFDDGEAEATGIYFGPDPNTLFLNIQHSAGDNDRTLMIRPVTE